jgi:hypothetical protein
MCKAFVDNFLAPYPQVIGVSKPAGTKGRGSDLGGFDNTEVVDRVRSKGIVYSTRLNAPRMLIGEKDFVGINDLKPRLTLEEIGRAEGHPEWIFEGARYVHEAEYQAAVAKAAGRAAKHQSKR